MARTGRPDFSFNGNIVNSYSGDDGKTWSYQESPFRGIGSGKRPVLMRLNEGPLLFVSYEKDHIYIALSMDDVETRPVRKHLADRTYGYLASNQTPDNMIHLITSREYFRFNLPWVKETASNYRNE